MKAVISKTDLVELINKLQGVISVKPAIPILSSVLIEATAGQLILSGTDLTTSMRCFSIATVIEEGSIVLPARRFFQLAREMTSPQVKISSLDERMAEISAGSSVFKMNGMSKNEFPTLPQFSGSAEVSFESSLLKEMLSKTSFAAAREDSRYAINGVLLRIFERKAIFIGTDGKRIAKSHTPIDLDASFQGAYVLPIKAVEEMIKMLEDTSKRAALSIMHDKILLESGNVALITKLLSGQFPNVEKVIPQNLATSLILHREEFSSLLKQVSLFTTEEGASVRFIFEDGQMDLKASKNNIGEGNVNMAVNYSGPRIEVAFNPFYILDILRHIKDETIKFSIIDASNPGVITDNSTSIFVMMPVRLETPKPNINAAETPMLV